LKSEKAFSIWLYFRLHQTLFFKRYFHPKQTKPKIQNNRYGLSTHSQYIGNITTICMSKKSTWSKCPSLDNALLGKKQNQLIWILVPGGRPLLTGVSLSALWSPSQSALIFGGSSVAPRPWWRCSSPRRLPPESATQSALSAPPSSKVRVAMMIRPLDSLTHQCPEAVHT